MRQVIGTPQRAAHIVGARRQPFNTALRLTTFVFRYVPSARSWIAIGLGFAAQRRPRSPSRTSQRETRNTRVSTTIQNANVNASGTKS